MTTQSATVDSSAWHSIYPASLRAEGAHWAAVWLYGALCAIGAVSTELGLGLLALFAILASLRVLLRNRIMLALMAAAAVAGSIFPPLGVVLAVVALLLLLKRIAFIFENIRVIGLGLVVYSVAIAAMAGADGIAQSVLEWMAVPALQDSGTRHVVAGLGAGALTSALMHDVLLKTYKRGYSTEKALEIMSMIPLLLMSMLLPLLKMHFNMEVPAEPGFAGGVHHGPVDFHGYGAAGEVVPEAMAFGQAANLHAMGTAPHHHVPDLVPHPMHHGGDVHAFGPADHVPSFHPAEPMFHGVEANPVGAHIGQPLTHFEAHSTVAGAHLDSPWPESSLPGAHAVGSPPPGPEFPHVTQTPYGTYSSQHVGHDLEMNHVGGDRSVFHQEVPGRVVEMHGHHVDRTFQQENPFSVRIHHGMPSFNDLHMNTDPGGHVHLVGPLGDVAMLMKSMDGRQWHYMDRAMGIRQPDQFFSADLTPGEIFRQMGKLA